MNKDGRMTLQERNLVQQIDDEEEFNKIWEMNKDELARHPGDKFIARWYFMKSRKLLRKELRKKLKDAGCKGIEFKFD